MLRPVPSILLRPLAVLALVIAAAPVRAQTLPEAGTVTVTPFLHTSIGIGDPAPDNSMGLGVAAAYDWTPRLAVEAEISHLFDVAGESALVDWPITNFSINGVYHFDTPYVTPYATLGIGFEHSGYSLEESDVLALVPDLSGTEITFNFGGGAKYRLTDKWQVRADLRRFQANDIAPDYWRLYAGLTYRVR